MPGCRAVIDDLAPRKSAASLGIPVTGTLGIVLRARRQGIIPAARPVVEDLLRGVPMGGPYRHRFIYEACSRLTVITSSAASGSIADSGTVTVAIESPNALNTSSTQPRSPPAGCST